jgi:hypothetical protein
MIESIFPSSNILDKPHTYFINATFDIRLDHSSQAILGLKKQMYYITFLLPLKKSTPTTTNIIPQVSPLIKVQISLLTLRIHDLLIIWVGFH